ncbi:hypothetical protein EJB05_31689, partial [Eragrostis curvula]
MLGAKLCFALPGTGRLLDHPIRKHARAIRSWLSYFYEWSRLLKQEQKWQRQCTCIGYRSSLAGKGRSMRPWVGAEVGYSVCPLLQLRRCIICDSCKAGLSMAAELIACLFDGLMDAAADIILWRDTKVSASILVAATAAWFLFEVAEYHFFSLVCYAAMIGMLVFFIWTNAAAFFNLPVPRIPETLLSERTTRQVTVALHSRLTRLAYKLYDVACGKDLITFLLTVLALYIASVIADCFSSLTLLYLVVLGTMTLPALYERYEIEIDHLVARGVHDLRSHFAEMDSGVLRKIPRGTGAAAKHY